jgi:YVTN family beta-propeller protein
VIDTATNTVVAAVPVGSNPFGVAVMPDGKHVYVTHLVPDPGSVSVIDTATNTVVAAVPMEGVPAAVAVTHRDSAVHVDGACIRDIGEFPVRGEGDPSLGVKPRPGPWPPPCRWPWLVNVGRRLRVDDGHGPDDPLHLVVEIKGYRREDAKEKKSTMETYWVPGVNHLGTYGRWAFAEFTEVYQIESDLKAKMASEFNKMIEFATVQPATGKI